MLTLTLTFQQTSDAIIYTYLLKSLHSNGVVNESQIVKSNGDLLTVEYSNNVKRVYLCDKYIVVKS